MIPSWAENDFQRGPINRVFACSDAGVAWPCVWYYLWVPQPFNHEVGRYPQAINLSLECFSPVTAENERKEVELQSFKDSKDAIEQLKIELNE